MLRSYKPITHEIFELHDLLEYLVCNVWAKACSKRCRTLLNDKWKNLYDNYEWLRKAINDIYKECKKLSDDEKSIIIDAFRTNNAIEDLCDGKVKPIYLTDLPDVVSNKMKPLLVKFYEELLERAKVPGNKLDYYQKLIDANDFKFCPCCGLIYFEPADSLRREAFDHYLPKSHYPFLSVNFKNLVPLCYKCNSDHKGRKNPIKNGRKAFYPFAPDAKSIDISIKIDDSIILKDKLDKKEFEILFSGDNDKVATWDDMFTIIDRYKSEIADYPTSILRELKEKQKKYKPIFGPLSIEQIVDMEIADCQIDKYKDRKFLKLPFLLELIAKDIISTLEEPEP